MRLAALLITVSFSLQVFGLSIALPKPEIIQPKEAWKYGIERAEKIVDKTTYIAITIDKRLLCEASKVEANAWLSTDIADKLIVLSAADAFTVKFEKTKYLRVDFIITCKNESKVHKGYKFIYQAWEKPIA